MGRMTAAQAVRLSEPDYERVLDQVMNAIAGRAILGARELRYSDPAFVAHFVPNKNDDVQITLIRNVLADLRQLGYVAHLNTHDNYLLVQW